MTIQGGRVDIEDLPKSKKDKWREIPGAGVAVSLNWVLVTGGSWNISLTHTFMCCSVYVIFFMVKVIRKKPNCAERQMK